MRSMGFLFCCCSWELIDRVYGGASNTNGDWVESTRWASEQVSAIAGFNFSRIRCNSVCVCSMRLLVVAGFFSLEEYQPNYSKQCSLDKFARIGNLNWEYQSGEAKTKAKRKKRTHWRGSILAGTLTGSEERNTIKLYDYYYFHLFLCVSSVRSVRKANGHRGIQRALHTLYTSSERYATVALLCGTTGRARWASILHINFWISHSEMWYRRTSTIGRQYHLSSPHAAYSVHTFIPQWPHCADGYVSVCCAVQE